MVSQSAFLAVVATYSYKRGIEEVTGLHPTMLDDISRVVAMMDADRFKSKVSKEIGWRKNRRLFSPIAMNRYLKEPLEPLGWERKRINFEAPSWPGASTHSGYREVDGLRDRVGLEIQFGKYAFQTYDIVTKFVIFHRRGFLDLGIEIVPMRSMTALMSRACPQTL